MHLAHKVATAQLALVVLVVELKALLKWCQERHCISMLVVRVENLRVAGTVVVQVETLTVVVAVQLMFVGRLL